MHIEIYIYMAADERVEGVIFNKKRRSKTLTTKNKSIMVVFLHVFTKFIEYN